MRITRHLPAVCASLAFAVPSVAQGPNAFQLPQIPGPFTQSPAPFGVGLVRYQVWMSAASWIANVNRPMAVNQLEIATQIGGSQTRNIQMEVRMANANPTTSSARFDSNFVSRETLVFPAVAGTGRAYQLPVSQANGFAVQIPFVNEFRWDGRSGVVVDIQVYDNGNFGQPYSYETRYSNFAGSGMTTMWSINNPQSQNAQFSFPGRGPQLRFLFRDGVSEPFGVGCAGEGSFVPLASTSGGDPIIANTMWTQELSMAAPGRSAIWMLGNSASAWAGLSLPHEMVEVGATGCNLLVAPDVTALFILPGGGSPGSASLSITTAVPPLPSLDGATLFSQWLIIDPNAANGVLSLSNGLLHYFSL